MYASDAKSLWMDLQEIFTKVDGSRTFSLHKEMASLTHRNASVSVYLSRVKNFVGGI